MFLKNFAEKIKIHISCSKCFSKNHSVYEQMWKTFCSAERAADDNTIGRMRLHAGKMDTNTQTHTHTETFTRTHLNVTFYLRWLSC
jgi:hypothetical protein